MKSRILDYFVCVLIVGFDTSYANTQTFGNTNTLILGQDTTIVGGKHFLNKTSQISNLGQENRVHNSSNVTSIGHELFVTNSQKITTIGDNIKINDASYLVAIGSGLQGSALSTNTFLIGKYNNANLPYHNRSAILIKGNGTNDAERDNSLVLYGEGVIDLAALQAQVHGILSRNILSDDASDSMRILKSEIEQLKADVQQLKADVTSLTSVAAKQAAIIDGTLIKNSEAANSTLTEEVRQLEVKYDAILKQSKKSCGCVGIAQLHQNLNCCVA